MMFHVVWTNHANLVKKEFTRLDDAVFSVVRAQIPAKIYNHNKKVVVNIDSTGISYV